MATAKHTAPPAESLVTRQQTSTDAPRFTTGLAGAVGRVLAERYRLGALLGQGGMGEVWRAEHILTRRPVAVKLLRDALAQRPDMRRRFLREARAAAAVNHPNVVEVLDAFELEDGIPVLVMPLLEGETLAALIAREAPLSLPVALELLLPLVSAVGAAHARGIVHRDLKPENVFLAGEREVRTVKVLDFGIAKSMELNGTDNESLTGTGILVGTPCYMAPEQGFGERDQDHRVDIWAIGVIAYEMFSGCKPIEGENIGQIVRNLLTSGITPLEAVAPGLPDSINRLVMSMLQRERADRPQDLREVYEALRLESVRDVPPFFVASVPLELAPSPDDELQAQQVFELAPTLNATPIAPAEPNRTDDARPRALPLALLGLGAATLLLIVLLVAAVAWWPRARHEPTLSAALPATTRAVIAPPPATSASASSAATSVTPPAVARPAARPARTLAPAERPAMPPPPNDSLHQPIAVPKPASSGLQEVPPF